MLVQDDGSTSFWYHAGGPRLRRLLLKVNEEGIEGVSSP